MPRVFRVGSYTIYFWANEGNPNEPVHVHVAEGEPTARATKIWITSNRKCLLCHNDSKIPGTKLSNIMRVIEARVDEILDLWKKYFGELKFYC